MHVGVLGVLDARAERHATSRRRRRAMAAVNNYNDPTFDRQRLSTFDACSVPLIGVASHCRRLVRFERAGSDGGAVLFCL